jgi:hypothetical protein
MARPLDQGGVDDRGAFTKTAGAGARAAVRKGPVGQSPRPPDRLPQQDDHRRRGIARRGVRGFDPQAVELALVGDPTAMRLCIERILPPCRERAVKFVLPPIESAADIAPAMKAVTSALAGGVITPGEAATIAAVVDTFVRAIETSEFERRLQLVEADHFNHQAEATRMNGAGPNGYFYNP